MVSVPFTVSCLLVFFKNLLALIVSIAIRIKRLHDDLGVNTAKVRVTAVKHKLVLL
ncbi:hypothetical protein Tco_0577788, partial [Tanacetum coccineum]